MCVVREAHWVLPALSTQAYKNWIYVNYTVCVREILVIIKVLYDYKASDHTGHSLFEQCESLP